MTLPLFNLSAIIRKYNQDLNKKPTGYSDAYHEEETFGFSGFKKLKQYHLRLQTINEAPDLFLFAKDESDYHRKRILPSIKHLRERLGHSGRHHSHTYPTYSLPKSSSIEKSLGEKQRFYNWQSLYHRHLTSLDWAKVAEQVSSIDQWRLKELKATWDRCAIFTRCTNEALLFIADQLPLLINDYKALQEEYIQKSKQLKRIPSVIQEAYFQHLTAVESQAENMLERLAAVMLAKLQIWDNTQGKTSTLFMSFQVQFKSMGLDILVPPAVTDPYAFSPDHFFQFHRFI
jgi:hypothetical protein